MTTTITGSWADPKTGTVTAATCTPDHVVGYQSTATTQTIIHPLLGRTYPDVTIRPAAARIGTLTMLFDDEAAGRACELLHAYTAGPLVLVSDDVVDVSMTFMPAGAITRTLDTVTSAVWVVAVPYQEIHP